MILLQYYEMANSLKVDRDHGVKIETHLPAYLTDAENSVIKSIFTGAIVKYLIVEIKNVSMLYNWTLYMSLLDFLKNVLPQTAEGNVYYVRRPIW